MKELQMLGIVGVGIVVCCVLWLFGASEAFASCDTKEEGKPPLVVVVQLELNEEYQLYKRLLLSEEEETILPLEKNLWEQDKKEDRKQERLLLGLFEK